jgi:uncharacterized protein YyaL (SSP411 family)
MPNLLATEPSAYLKGAAHQPVHWHPWGDAAFARAHAEDKPVLLDIGAVWCHWCHVMDGESYDNPALAAILNRDFVCIKVDRDERPDVDARYQRAVQALTGQGGWPLTAFLTPAGEVFFGGTYFPPADHHSGRPGFGSVLQQVLGIYRQQRDKVTQHATAIRQHVAESLNEAKGGPLTPAILDDAASQMARLFDIRYGGFGTAPKFPHPGACDFLLARWHDRREEWTREIVAKTLTGMAQGGIRDHVGGGFHRYAVDERWIVPHFEKLASDNAELLHAYLNGYAALGTPLFKEVAEGIVTWVFEVLSDPGRTVCYGSQDADVRFGDDGDYWTWTPAEVRSAVEDATAFEVTRRVFDIEVPGEMSHNREKNVLWWSRDPARDEEWPILRAALQRLKAARDRRPAPPVDTTPYVNWNAMLAAALLRAGAVLDRPECNTLGLNVLRHIWMEAWSAERGMARVIGRREPHGLLDDHVHAAAAFLDAYEATGEAAWLERAVTVMHYCGRVYWDEEGGGFFDVPRDGPGIAYLATPAKPIQDAPSPSANGVAALVLARLGAFTDDPEWRRLLDRQLATFAGAAPHLSLHGATLLRGADWGLSPVTRIEVLGPPGPGPACAMHLLALQTYRPRKVVLRKPADRPTATVCVGSTCSLPVDTPAALAELLR